ncbi:amidase signature enzyme [Setomelanomma holmii]|uniref:Amidase signature enzyme n=1 Tax=Setomelanomma holmii TaxID=210430 RepID=A0A9P4H563_9PLEO|nr:amidase signature enzyme [Setomelanomma holmii]
MVPSRPLHGVPILLKDNIVTLDSMQSTSGSFALIDCRPEEEAAFATALRKAGAIILGKANLAEWVGLRTTDSTTGWSPRGGQATEIFYPNMKAFGSSTGSAISTSLGLTFASFGTETISSIVSPAEKSAVVGFKPTKELISSAGIIYDSRRQDAIGLLTRNVRDAAHILREILRHTSDHARDALGSPLTPKLAVGSSDTDLRDVRIGIPGNIGVMRSISSIKQEAFDEAYEDLPQESKQVILDTDLKISMDYYLSTLKSNPHNLRRLEDVIDFTKHSRAEEYPERDMGGFARAAKTDPADKPYREMLTRDEYFVGEGGIAGAIDRHNLHVLLMSTASMTMSTFAAKAGSSVMSVPLGFFPPGTKVEHESKNELVNVAPNIPKADQNDIYSLYIFGKANADDDVLRVGHVFEQLSIVQDRARPYKMPRTDLSDVVRSSGSQSKL